jgi:hypothetical protein
MTSTFLAAYQVEFATTYPVFDELGIEEMHLLNGKDFSSPVRRYPREYVQPVLPEKAPRLRLVAELFARQLVPA